MEYPMINSFYWSANNSISNIKFHLQKKITTKNKTKTLKHWNSYCTFNIPEYLQVTKCNESDEGKYMCAGENDKGVTFSFPANLYVRGESIIITINYLFLRASECNRMQ